MSMSKEIEATAELKVLSMHLKAIMARIVSLNCLIAESEARIAAFEAKYRPQSPSSEQSESQEGSRQGNS